MMWREKLSGGQQEVAEENHLPHLEDMDTLRSVEDVKLIEESKFWEEHHSTLGNYKKVHLECAHSIYSRHGMQLL